MGAALLPFGHRDERAQAAARQELVDTLKRLLDGQSDLKAFPGNFKIALDDRVWECERVAASGRTIAPTTFHAFIHEPYPEGIGANYEVVERLIGGDAEAVVLYTKASTRRPGAPEGNQNAAKTETTFDNIQGCSQPAPTGTSAAAGLRRLLKEAEGGNETAASKLEAVKAGRKSVNAAMVECGFRKTLDPRVKAEGAHFAAQWAVEHARGDVDALVTLEAHYRRAGAVNIANQLANMIKGDSPIMDRRFGWTA